MKKLKAVVFDVDNTLIDRRKAFYDLCSYIINKYSPLYPIDGSKDELIAHMVRIDGDGYGGLKKFIPTLKKYWNMEITTEDFLNDRNEVFGKLSVPMPDLYEVLEILKKKYKLGIITNGYSKVQRDKIDTVKIADYFDDIIVSGETDYEKPDREIFELSCRNLGVEPDETVYVGDYFPNDIAGAIGAKIMPIWINEDPNEHKEYEGIRITKLTDLLKLL